MNCARQSAATGLTTDVFVGSGCPELAEFLSLAGKDAIIRSYGTGSGLSEGSKSAADRLVEGLANDSGSDLIRFIVRRVRTREDARDLAQEVYVRLLRVERKELIRHPRAYLYRVAANVLHEFELKRKADSLGFSRWSDEQRSDGGGGYGEVEAEDPALRSRLEGVLAELSPKCRAVLILHRRDGMTYDEIGAKIGISAGMVKKYLQQGLRHCRERLAELR
jgi:RNA polymerase sigma-70 factor (ECF subfamily)